MAGFGVRAPLLLLLGVVFRIRGAEIKAVSRSDVTFRADVADRPTEINWYRGSTKIVDVEEGRQPDFYNLEERCIVDLQSGTLILKNVTVADSGDYKAERLLQGKKSTDHFTLQVYDPVCAVVIRSTVIENNVTLHCECDRPIRPSADPTNYKWINGSGANVFNGSKITVQKKKKTEQWYKCQAANQVSNSTANFTVPARPPHKRSHVIVCVLIPIFLLLLIIIILWYLYKRDTPEPDSKEPLKDPQNNEETKPLIHQTPQEPNNEESLKDLQNNEERKPQIQETPPEPDNEEPLKELENNEERKPLIHQTTPEPNNEEPLKDLQNNTGGYTCSGIRPPVQKNEEPLKDLQKNEERKPQIQGTTPEPNNEESLKELEKKEERKPQIQETPPEPDNEERLNDLQNNEETKPVIQGTREEEEEESDTDGVTPDPRNGVTPDPRTTSLTIRDVSEEDNGTDIMEADGGQSIKFNL